MKAHIFNRFSVITLMALVFGFVAGCEGPMGPAGADGVDGMDGMDGVDGDVTCLVCHSDGNIQSVNQQFVESVHSGGEVAVSYAGGRFYCAECHSHEGFLEFVATGDVEGDIVSPSAWECATCHGIHETFEEVDYALRLDDPIAFIFDNAVVADFGNGNLCANCHQSRRAEPNTTNPGTDFTITNTHYGPHHGAQSNVLYGAGMAELTGSASYPSPGMTSGGETFPHMTIGCTGCHMGDYSSGTGGHTFNPSINNCTSCHAGATDFDIGSTMTDVAAQLDVLRDLLEAQGVIEEGIAEIFELDPETGDIVSVLESDGFHPVVGTHTMAQSQAFFNWVGLLEDRSFGAHNPAYTRALLTNSIEAID
ncbi:MAG: hypothetical protein ABJG78_10735 [Cyclobacteriaceae bacterium]